MTTSQRRCIVCNATTPHIKVGKNDFSCVCCAKTVEKVFKGGQESGETKK